MNRNKAASIKKIVMKNVLNIEFGTTQTYKQIALKSGRNINPRTIGRIVGTNENLIAVPCHRVVCSSGDTGGYKLGRDFKKFLLEWEKKIIS